MPKRRDREGSTLLPTILLMAASALCLVAVPLVGVCLSHGLAAHAVRYLAATSAEEAQRRCAQLTDAVPFTADSCQLLLSARLIEHAYIASVALLVIVLMSFWVATLTVARSRERLSRLFPVAIHACLAAVVLTLLAQGTLLLWLMWERALAGHQDLVARMNLFRRAAEPSRLTTALLASEQPHPFDTHPPFSARAAAFNLAAAPIIARSLADINDFRVAGRAMRELEEALTKVMTDRMRKGNDLEVDRDPSTPFELAWPE